MIPSSPSIHDRESVVARLAAAAIAAIVLTTSGLIVQAPTPALASSVFTPSADTYVDASKPTSNFGASTSMRIDGSPVKTAYLRFDVSGVGGPSAARLQLFFQSNLSQLVTVHAVADTTWSESTMTYASAPLLGPALASASSIQSGSWVSFDVSAAISGDGPVAFAVTTSGSSASRFSSREGTNPAQLLVPPPPVASSFVVTRSGTTYTADSGTGSSYTGSLKFAVESAVAELEQAGGGSIQFLAGTYDLGSEYFKLQDAFDLTFYGAGMDATIITNSSSQAADTEPFNFSGAVRVTIRDLTVSAGGPLRSTSDAIDFDRGNDSLVERVKIVSSRARGIIFDGKNAGWTADGNVVRDCVITGIPGKGIELLASNDNLIEGCTITDVAGHGIQVNKASTLADQPNKKSNDNIIRDNTIVNAGQDGINVSSGDRNQIVGNTILNSSDDVSGRDGIRIVSTNSIACDDNVVDGNLATDNQATKTQSYGLNIASSNCNRTAVGTNDFAGNRVGSIQDLGTGTIYAPPAPDGEPPSQPTGLQAVAVSGCRVDLTWNASTDNIGVTGYGVYRDSVLLATVGGSTLAYVDATVGPGVTYAYEVDATDAATNHSALSAPAVVATPGASCGTTLTPTADSWVDASQPTVNNGTKSQLRADGSPVLVSYLKFNVQVAGTVSRATLRIFANSSHGVGFDVRPVADSTWTETGLTYDNAPGYGGVAASSGPLTAGTWVEVDVTGLVATNGLLSLALTTSSGTAMSLGSREAGTTSPQLVIETQ